MFQKEFHRQISRIEINGQLRGHSVGVEETEQESLGDKVITKEVENHIQASARPEYHTATHPLHSILARCMFDNVDIHSWQSSLEAMVELCQVRERPGAWYVDINSASEVEMATELMKIKCCKTQCPFCLGDPNMSLMLRLHKFSSACALREHVLQRHWKGKEPSPDVSMTCPHPFCDFSEPMYLSHFKNHVAQVHGIFL